MEIKELRECMEHKETIIRWMNQEFGTERSFPFYESLVNHSLKEKQLPITFAAVEGEELLGTVGIWRSDLLSRQELCPWLSALIVNPQKRNQGIGKSLQDYVLHYCSCEGYQELYLYTELQGYYEKNNWVMLDTGYEYMGGKVTIYKHSL